jgi:putative SOS response-associated peptidase YedK
MCGRFILTATPQQLADYFGIMAPLPRAPQYNIPPSAKVLAVRRRRGQPGRELVTLRWGLIPAWASDPKIGNRLINARAETAAEKPAFRAAFRHRRCLVLADGFFEWQRLGGTRVPYLVRLKDGSPFAFAGLWDHWRGEKGGGRGDLRGPDDEGQ